MSLPWLLQQKSPLGNVIGMFLRDLEGLGARFSFPLLGGVSKCSPRCPYMVIGYRVVIRWQTMIQAWSHCSDR